MKKRKKQWGNNHERVFDDAKELKCTKEVRNMLVSSLGVGSSYLVSIKASSINVPCSIALRRRRARPEPIGLAASDLARPFSLSLVLTSAFPAVAHREDTASSSSSSLLLKSTVVYLYSSRNLRLTRVRSHALLYQTSIDLF